MISLSVCTRADDLSDHYSESDRLDFVLSHGDRPFLERLIEPLTGTTLFRAIGAVVWHDTMRAAIDTGIRIQRLKRVVG
ncbi:MAG: hypothetical protein EPN62_08590 [Candidimonas sp.]|nr:MAG: hypothetical protein EPN77_05825 [Candidimonas sp.]TAM23724.1 MAG: hypothetical protein EPN62_08590 [Candidimonas sp.]